MHKNAPENARKSQKVPKLGLLGCVLTFSGIFGHFFADPQRLFFRLFFCDLGPGAGPGDSCKWSFLGHALFFAIGRYISYFQPISMLWVRQRIASRDSESWGRLGDGLGSAFRNEKQPKAKVQQVLNVGAQTWELESRSKAQERKISPKRKFLGRTSCGYPGVIRADIPAQNFGQGGQNPGKKQAFWRGHPWPEGADVHDPKGFPTTSVRKTLGWIFIP